MDILLSHATTYASPTTLLSFLFLPPLLLLSLYTLFPPRYLIRSLHIYPIKSCASIPVNSLQITSKGIQNDRQYIVITRDKDDTKWEVVTQRENPRLALIKPQLNEKNEVTITFDEDSKIFPLKINHTSSNFQVELFRCFVTSSLIPNSDTYLKKHFPKKNYHIAYCHTGRDSTLDTKWFDCYSKNESAGAVDGSQVLLTFQRSLSALNSKLYRDDVGMSNFRPNIVFESSGIFNKIVEWEDDYLRTFKILNLNFRVNKPCHRCILSTVLQDEGRFDKSLEPLKTLRKVRYLRDSRFGERPGNSPGFGVNCSLVGEGGVLEVGMEGSGKWGIWRRSGWKNCAEN
ncbi:hypothetical protein TrLO_g6942 [Triparma laevis f. longispina]|uniref:MOSC domain-containing protein n=1 Tax=Triparma laevis f. longispina TaxID=1714387 RepID=A0A9W7E875_9STRA|nr:hypothetical protein TrLO_g6942 [Triparma laevis f. longispina]